MGSTNNKFLPVTNDDKSFTWRNFSKTPTRVYEELAIVVPEFHWRTTLRSSYERPFIEDGHVPLIDVHGEQRPLGTMTIRDLQVGDTKTFYYISLNGIYHFYVGPYDRSRSPSFTPFGGSDFLMEEIDEFLEHDDSIPPGVDGIYDSEGDTVYLEELLNPPDLELKRLTSILRSLVKPLVYVSLRGRHNRGVKMKKNELYHRLVMGWVFALDYRKLKDATGKDHFTYHSWIDAVERLAGGNEYYCFWTDSLATFQIPIKPT
ncbi:hypothetical protein Tco_0792988 [Tanacetum coccineum]